jgi:EAL domain-containing protein (putative c-di-GMP-specific phosphodiesterase class I)
MIIACHGLDISVIAEGVETVDEFRTLLGMNVSLFQGYLFAKPQFESLPVLTDDVQEMIREVSQSVKLNP